MSRIRSFLVTNLFVCIGYCRLHPDFGKSTTSNLRKIEVKVFVSRYRICDT